MINFYLPNFCEWQFRVLNNFFIDNIRDHPEYFYPDIQIGAVYGCFPGTVWNGGRTMLGEVPLSEIIEIIDEYNGKGIPIRFTYTNGLVSADHFENSYANIITALAHNGQNEILVNSKELEDFLRERFPNFKYLSSTTKCLMNEDDIKNESENYYLTVLDYRKNCDIAFLMSLPHPEKFELLINAYCDPKCMMREQHYRILAQSQIDNDSYDISCSFRKNNFFEALEWDTVIKLDDLYSTYVDMGFKHFKIEGRTNHIVDVLESYLYYMVKPEYKDFIRYEVSKVLF